MRLPPLASHRRVGWKLALQLHFSAVLQPAINWNWCSQSTGTRTTYDVTCTRRDLSFSELFVAKVSEISVAARPRGWGHFFRLRTGGMGPMTAKLDEIAIRRFDQRRLPVTSLNCPQKPVFRPCWVRKRLTKASCVSNPAKSGIPAASD